MGRSLLILLLRRLWFHMERRWRQNITLHFIYTPEDAMSVFLFTISEIFYLQMRSWTSTLVWMTWSMEWSGVISLNGRIMLALVWVIGSCQRPQYITIVDGWTIFRSGDRLIEIVLLMIFLYFYYWSGRGWQIGTRNWEIGYGLRLRCSFCCELLDLSTMTPTIEG